MRTGWFDDENYAPPIGKPSMILFIIVGIGWLAYKLLGG